MANRSRGASGKAHSEDGGRTPVLWVCSSKSFLMKKEDLQTLVFSQNIRPSIKDEKPNTIKTSCCIFFFAWLQWTPLEW